MEFKLIMKPLDDGGTCILDYDPEYQDKMEKSIMLCGREDLILCSVPVIYEGKHSLHLISNNTNIDDFWDACMKVSEEDEQGT